MAADPIPHELLLSHAGFLRRLARDLVRDPAAAEDAVQEVWLRALESPPRERANLRGWMRTVLLNFVRTKARGDSRRSARELEHGRERDADALEQESTLRSVTEAVLALDEPLRSTVLQHYFQGLTAAEIAERDHLPVSTVKSRLQRALEMLRARMQRTSGDRWQASLLALTVPSKIGKGVILMSLKTKLALGCALLACAVLAYRGWSRPAASNPSPIAASEPALAASAPKDEPAAKPPIENDSKPTDRVASVDPTAAAAAAEEPPETLFYGSLRDPAGKLLTGLWSAGVSVTDAEGRRRFADAKESGAFAVNGLPYGKYWVHAGADGFRGAAATIELSAAHAQLKQDFTLQPVPIIKVRVSTPDGKSLFGEQHESMQLKGRPVLVPVATKERPGKWFNEVVGSLNNPFGIGHFWQYGPRAEKLPKGYMGILMLDQELPAFVSLVNYHRVLQTKELQPGEDEVNFEISLEDIEASMGSLRMQVVDAGTQAPVKGANAMLWGGASMDGGSASDASGDILIDGREPGEFDLHVRAKGYEEYKAHILVDSGTPTDLGQIALDKAIAVEIKVVDGTGAPCNTKFSVGVFDPSTKVLDMERQQSWASRGDGVLALGTLGRHVYVVRTDNHDAVNDEANEDPKWVSGDVMLDLRSGVAPANVVIKLVPATRVMIVPKGVTTQGLRFRVTDEQGLDLVSSRFYGDGPRPLTIPQGSYKLALLDANKTVLREQPLVVGSTPMTVELSR